MGGWSRTTELTRFHVSRQSEVTQEKKQRPFWCGVDFVNKMWLICLLYSRTENYNLCISLLQSTCQSIWQIHNSVLKYMLLQG